MSSRFYPIGIDCSWVASDRMGHVGVFVIAGVGPVPIPLLEQDGMAVEDMEELIWTLPVTSAALVLPTVSEDADFVRMAERGVFVYDWTDVHRTLRNETHAYELVARPAKPVAAGTLPEEVARIARIVTIGAISFGESEHLDVRTHVECRDGTAR
jgi:hypothetical protein